MISLVEVFRSVQGEGYNSGRAAIFVRFTGCNLACRFADGAVCDTPYQESNIKVESVDDLFIHRIFPLLQDGERPRRLQGPYEQRIMLILTGGEPTRQPCFDEVARRAQALGFYVAVETNGTRYRDGFHFCDWICVSPKDRVAQGSPMPHHNPHPQSSVLDPRVCAFLRDRSDSPSGEYRYVISAADDPPPTYRAAFRHYLSPAINSDGSGQEWKNGFPGFVRGALERCLEIIQEQPWWRLSLQTHKIIMQR